MDRESLGKMSLEELEQLVRDGEVYEKQLKQRTAFKNFSPLPFQREWYDSCVNRTHDVVCLFAGNQVGKSTLGANITVGRCLGEYSPAVGGKPLPTNWAKDSLKGKRFLAAGETFEVSLRDTIVPKIREFVTPEMLVGKPKHNNMGIPVIWRFVTGAELVLMSYQQAKDRFEGAVWDGVWFDEPPPQEVYNAIRRGCMARSGQILITATPLKEPWMLDELLLPSRDENHPLSGTVAEYQADIWVNAKSNGGVLPDRQIETFLAGLPEKERAAREFGQFVDLQGIEFSYVREESHVVPDFEIPANWPMVEVCDPSYKRGLHLCWFVCDPDDYWFCVQAANVPNGTISEIASGIRRWRDTLGRVPERAIMDQRGGSHELNKDTAATWFDELRKRDLHYEPSQEERVGNKSTSISKLHEWLKPAWDTAKEKFIPKIRMTERVAKLERGPLWAFRRFQWNPMDSTKKKYSQPGKDMVDCWMYLAAHRGLTYRRLARNGEVGQRGPRISQSYAPPPRTRVIVPKMSPTRGPRYGRSRSRRP